MFPEFWNYENPAIPKIISGIRQNTCDPGIKHLLVFILLVINYFICLYLAIGWLVFCSRLRRGRGEHYSRPFPNDVIFARKSASGAPRKMHYFQPKSASGAKNRRRHHRPIPNDLISGRKSASGAPRSASFHRPLQIHEKQ